MSTVLSSLSSISFGPWSVSFAAATGQDLILEYEALGGPAPASDPTATAMNLRVTFNGVQTTIVQTHRWTDHLVIIPDRRTLILPASLIIPSPPSFTFPFPFPFPFPPANPHPNTLILQSDVPNDFFFIGPVYIAS
jgi:hypothetical protein